MGDFTVLETPFSVLERKKEVNTVLNLWMFAFATAYEKFISEDQETLPSLVCAITGEYKLRHIPITFEQSSSNWNRSLY